MDSLLDELYDALPLTGKQDDKLEQEKNEELLDEKLEWYYNNQAVLYSGDRFLLDRSLDYLKLLRAEEKSELVNRLNRLSDVYAAELAKTMRPITLFFPPKSATAKERQEGGGGKRV